MTEDLSARSNRLERKGLDETVEVGYRWLATARVSIDSGRDIEPYANVALVAGHYLRIWITESKITRSIVQL